MLQRAAATAPSWGLKRTPLQITFAERFCRAARPGGSGCRGSGGCSDPGPIPAGMEVEGGGQAFHSIPGHCTASWGIPGLSAASWGIPGYPPAREIDIYIDIKYIYITDYPWINRRGEDGGARPPWHRHKAVNKQLMSLASRPHRVPPEARGNHRAWHGTAPAWPPSPLPQGTHKKTSLKFLQEKSPSFTTDFPSPLEWGLF